MARRITPEGPGTTGGGKPQRPEKFIKSSLTNQGFLRPFALETTRRAYLPKQLKNERSGAKTSIPKANVERELQRIAARQQLKGNPFATVNSAKKNYKKRLEARSVTGPKTDKAVGTRQRGFSNETMDTSLNPLGGGPRPTKNRYLNTWESPNVVGPKRPAGVARKPKIVPFSTMSPTDTSSRVSSSGYVDMPNKVFRKGLFSKSSGVNSLVKAGVDIAAQAIVGRSTKKSDGSWSTTKAQNVKTANNSFSIKPSLPWRGKKGSATGGSRRIGR